MRFGIDFATPFFGMYKGIYIALSGAATKQDQLDVIARNISNAKTLGFKQDRAAFKDFLMTGRDGAGSEPDGRTMTELARVVPDFTDGAFIETGNPMDITLIGRGLIKLEDGRYTRRGDFKLDGEGYLCSYKNVRVMGSDGPIHIPPGEVEMGTDGQISVNGQPVGRISIVDFKDPEALQKAGEDFILKNKDAEEVPAQAQVRQGVLENSNVDAVLEMARMIKMYREFEACQKAIAAFDEATSKVTNEMPR